MSKSERPPTQCPVGRTLERVGDGWLPSQSYVPPEALAESNTRIDEAAIGAGRDPIAVRRLYNVDPSGDPAWAEWLAELALEHGMSTFIVTGDDPDVIQRFGAEVAPAVRELVRAAREGNPAPPVERPQPFGPAACGGQTDIASADLPPGRSIRAASHA